MNFLLMMYLNFVRGPQLAAKQREQEEKARIAKELEDHKNGVVVPPKTCKKCDALIQDSTKRYVDAVRPLCLKCQTIEGANAEAEARHLQEEMKMTPFLWFQCFMILLGLTMYIHRNWVPLF